MAPAKAYRLPPSASRQRGLPSIGFELLPPDALEVTPVPEGPSLVRCCERRENAVVGEIELSVFGGGMIIDREGTLEAKASDEAGAPAVPISLPGAKGYRAGAISDSPLPYLYVFAVAPRDLAVDGGVLVTVRSATPDWPAGEAILHSLRIITRHGRHPTVSNDDSGPRVLPLVGDPADE